MIRQVEDNRELLENHMEALLRINESRNELGNMIGELESKYGKLEGQLAELLELSNHLQRTKPDNI